MNDDDDEGPVDYLDDPDAAEAVQLAKAVLAGSTSLVQGCRRLRKILYHLDVVDDQPFAIISEVSAKAIEFPMPEDRHLWNPEVAASTDAELEAWSAQVRGAVLAACAGVVRRFGAVG